MAIEQIADIGKAIRQRNAASIASLMFDPSSWTLRPGYLTETEYWDYKVTGPSPGAGTSEEWANLAKDVLAFHNHCGGVILLGIGNDFKSVGYRGQMDSKLLQITGVGGAGKTALATWAVLRAYERKQFQFIVSTTAKDRELTAHGIHTLSPKLTSFESLLNSVLDVLNFPELKEHPIGEKEKKVREVLENSGGLLFVDNLETVDDPRIIQLLDDLPLGVRALVTSRRDTVRVSVFPIQLEWLSENEGRMFIRSLRRVFKMV